MALEIELNSPFFLKSKVYHSRKFEIDHAFTYSTLNVFCDVDHIDQLNHVFNKKFSGWMQIKSESYFNKVKNISLKDKINSWIFEKFNLRFEKIVLQTMPSFLGYVFNPISFWYCYDNQILKAVLCDVNNTFGEKYFYWIYAGGEDLLKLKVQQNKQFHVSPFFSTDGYYQFSFLQKGTQVFSEVTLFDSKDVLKIKTWIHGDLTPLNELSLVKILKKYGLFTGLVIFRIHFQALKLFLKKATFFKKPKYPNTEVQHESIIIHR